LQPNPVASAFVQGAMERAARLVAAGERLATALQRLAVVTLLHDQRPEITTLVDTELSAFATPEFAVARWRSTASNDSQAVALSVIDAPDRINHLSFLCSIPTRRQHRCGRTDVRRASLFAHRWRGLSSYSRQTRTHVARSWPCRRWVRMHRQPVRPEGERRPEALRALSRIGSTRAAELVGVIARDARDWMSTATIETLLRFQPEVAAKALRDLLAHRPFVLAQPAAASRIISRAAQAKGHNNLDPVLRDIWCCGIGSGTARWCAPRAMQARSFSNERDPDSGPISHPGCGRDGKPRRSVAGCEGSHHPAPAGRLVSAGTSLDRRSCAGSTQPFGVVSASAALQLASCADVHIDGDAYRREQERHLISELTDLGIHPDRSGRIAAELRRRPNSSAVRRTAAARHPGASVPPACDRSWGASPLDTKYNPCVPDVRQVRSIRRTKKPGRGAGGIPPPRQAVTSMPTPYVTRSSSSCVAWPAATLPWATYSR
jgi:hypothetical protein